MISVIFIAIGILILIGLVLLNLEHHARKIKIAVVILVLIMIYFSVVNVLNSGNVELNSPRGVVGGVYYYFGWLGHSMGQLWDIGKESVIAVGNVIKMNTTQESDGRN